MTLVTSKVSNQKMSEGNTGDDSRQTKLKLCFNNDVHKVPIDDFKTLTFTELQMIVKQTIPTLLGGSFKLYWKDEEKETIYVNSDSELSEALRVMTVNEKQIRFNVVSDTIESGTCHTSSAVPFSFSSILSSLLPPLSAPASASHAVTNHTDRMPTFFQASTDSPLTPCNAMVISCLKGPYVGEIKGYVYTEEGQCRFSNLQEATAAALRTPKCRGITQESVNVFTLRKKRNLKPSMKGELTWILKTDEVNIQPMLKHQAKQMKKEGRSEGDTRNKYQSTEGENNHHHNKDSKNDQITSTHTNNSEAAYGDDGGIMVVDPTFSPAIIATHTRAFKDEATTSTTSLDSLASSLAAKSANGVNDDDGVQQIMKRNANQLTTGGPYQGVLKGYAYTSDGRYSFATLEEAVSAATADAPKCRGITQESENVFTLRKKRNLKPSMKGELTWILKTDEVNIKRGVEINSPA